jgi:hypothetical protein
MTTVKTVSKTVLIRKWNQIEPKLLAVLAGLASATALTALAGLFHYKLDPTLAVAVAGLLSLLVGYFKSSTLKAFPTAEAVTDAGAIVAAAVPAIAPEVATVETILAPALNAPFIPATQVPLDASMPLTGALSPTP